MKAANTCEAGLPRPRCGYISEINAAKKQKDISFTGHDMAPHLPHLISVVTFNEWGEGSQIELAETLSDGKSATIINAPGQVDHGSRYLGYLSDKPSVAPTKENLYLNITKNQLSNCVPKNPGSFAPEPTVIPLIEP